MSISDSNTRTTITIPKELKSKLEEMAKNQNRSLNNLIVTILGAYLRAETADPDRTIVMAYDYSDEPVIMEYDPSEIEE
ncbi:hypothetical protein [Parasporobacterium paucivorans]|uniref:CopG-like RHH_1 or ribbon-helix-helix domain-containing protein, RHH_5 n=1 Tax=Parasporobacterium paucivorans DSM 15970 TaxID=1122934 RepID=A0A1M6HLU5_9FIRM|nr:hypothetical protein [Parasporobacterium paucivorans]SHJ23124.1 CopG-like RHH_1 or ribbon-helix-helix domain-containing protein, RHH_5 [Parasporobacterium paucivorans DSM 15970]